MKYQSREFCKDTKCPIQHLLDNAEDKMDVEFAKEYCHNDCSAYDFHKWLEENNYSIVKDFDYDILYLRCLFDDVIRILNNSIKGEVEILGLHTILRDLDKYIKDLEGDQGKSIREKKHEDMLAIKEGRDETDN